MSTRRVVDAPKGNVDAPKGNNVKLYLGCIRSCSRCARDIAPPNANQIRIRRRARERRIRNHALPSPHIVVTRKKPRGNKLALKKLPCKPLLPAPLR